MQIASKLAEAQKWYVLQQSTRPMLSPALAKSSKDFMETCSLLLESPDAHKLVSAKILGKKLDQKHIHVLYLVSLLLFHSLSFDFRKVQILFEWLKTTVSVTRLASPITPVEEVGAVAPQTKDIDLNSLHGPNFQQKFMNLLLSSQ